MSHNQPFKSDTKVINPGSPLEFFDFVPLLGPNGGRVVVDKFILCVAGTITVATANWDGRDVPRLMGLINVEDRSGKLRWSLSGYKSRIMSIMMHGIQRHEEHAAVVIGAAQAVDLRLVIPMSKPYLVRPEDFALPADLFKKITINWNALAQAATGTTVLSAATLNAYILAEYHEEHAVEFKAEDIVKSVDFNSNTQARFSLAGAVHDLYVVKEDTTAGGASIAAITDARIEDLGIPLLSRLDLVHSFRVKRETTASGPTTPGTQRFLEPVQEGKCLPVIVADDGTSLWDGKVVESMKLDVGTGASGLAGITREVTEKSQANFNAQLARYRVDPRSLRMKTAGKTRRGLHDGWTDRQRLVGVWSAPLPKAA